MTSLARKAPRPVAPRRIRNMLTTRSVEQVAADLRLDPAEVEAIINSGTVIVLRDNDTGREWRTGGWRGAYRRVCMQGLTDWEWWRENRGAAC